MVVARCNWSSMRSSRGVVSHSVTADNYLAGIRMCVDCNHALPMRVPTTRRKEHYYPSHHSWTVCCDCYETRNRTTYYEEKQMKDDEDDDGKG